MNSCWLGTDHKTDQRVVLLALVIILVASWSFVVGGAGMHMSAFEMTRMEIAQMSRVLSGEGAMAGAMPMESTPWTFQSAVLVFFMWWIMMIAMMLPTAVKAVLAYTANARSSGGQTSPYPSIAAFVAGYLLIWALFSLASVATQWVLQRAGLITPMLVIKSLPLDAILLLLAGAYQFTPIQRESLRSCRACEQTMRSNWRDGRRGAFVMGLQEGVSCLNSCWPLMLLLFLAGAMNLYWIVGLAAAVLLQKVAPAGDRLGYAIGVFLIAWGLFEVLMALR